ncbi:MAG TPA: hypothetical protein VK548_25980 [Candidatus Acidoferrum sp.]|nr:hypothetical protein [Candidatus Acidoferrum sp.]
MQTLEVTSVLTDSDGLIAGAAKSTATLRVLVAESRRLIAQAARLCRMALPIRGSSDLDSPFIVEIIVQTPLCLDCVSKKTGISEDRARESMLRIGSFMVVDVASGPCGGCLDVKTTYRISDQAPRGNGDGAGTRPPARPAVVTQSAALWEFLASHRGQMFCTQCIATALFATKRVDRAVLGAEGRGARRQYGTCSSCGKERLLCGLTR